MIITPLKRTVSAKRSRNRPIPAPKARFSAQNLAILIWKGKNQEKSVQTFLFFFR